MSQFQFHWFNDTVSQPAWLRRVDDRIPGGEQSRNILFALLSLYLVYQLLWASSHDPREPKLIKSSVPILGHIVGIYKHGSRHFTWIAYVYKISQLFRSYERKENRKRIPSNLSHTDTPSSQKTGLPIYLLPILGGGRIAIAHTPDVLSAIDRNPTAVAFIPLAALVIKKLSGLSAKGNKILCGKTAGPDRHEGYMHILSKGVHSTLAPGPSLDAVTSIVAYDLNDSIRELHGKTTRINVLHWFRHVFGISSTDGIYGPGNPFKDPKVEAGFWYDPWIRSFFQFPGY